MRDSHWAVFGVLNTQTAVSTRFPRITIALGYFEFTADLVMLAPDDQTKTITIASVCIPERSPSGGACLHDLLYLTHDLEHGGFDFGLLTHKPRGWHGYRDCVNFASQVGEGKPNG